MQQMTMPMLERLDQQERPILQQQAEQETRIAKQDVLRLRFNVIQTQLDTVSTQATLVVGFTLSMWAGETLSPLTDDQGPHCIYKSWVSQAFGLTFFLSVAVGVSLCSIVVGLSCFVKQQSLKYFILSHE